MSEVSLDTERNTKDANAENDNGVVVVSTSQLTVAPTTRCGPLISITPVDRGLVMSAGRMAATVADGLFLSSTSVNQVMSVAFFAYDSFKAVVDYHRGELNILGYPMTLTDVTLNIGKALGNGIVGFSIGCGIGAAFGLSAIPAAGQVVAATMLSISLGYCVCTLLTRYVDRFFVRLQLQAQYGYKHNEHKARSRFEQLLEAQHDLSSFDTCRIVQHYRDYRVACGWESYSGLDDYRASGDINMMPVSFQHFAIVQLQRKWGFLNERNECKKVYKALSLLHHPDRGGDRELGAQLNHDYEIYCFCQGWQKGCSATQQNETNKGEDSKTDGVKKQRKNVVAHFLRSLFRSVENSAVEAENLRQNGLVALEVGTPLELHRHNQVNLSDIDDIDDIDEEVQHNDNLATGTNAFVQQRSVSRVLASIRLCYQLATEAITFAGLVSLYREEKRWQQLERDIFLFNRLHTFVSVVDDDNIDSSLERCCYGVRWRTKEEAVARREKIRESIISCCFPPHVSSKLMEALNLWKTAQSLAESFFRHSNNNNNSGGGGGVGAAAERRGGEKITCSRHILGETGQTLETLLNIQKALQQMTDTSTRSWMNSESTIEETLDSHFVENVKALGLTASFALAGAHANSVCMMLWQNCVEFCNTRQRKLDAVSLLLNEINELRACFVKSSAEEKEKLQTAHDDFMKQLFIMHYVFAEVDIAVAELYDIYTVHFPERSSILKTLPSVCARCVNKELRIPRFVKYERERTLMNYMNVEVEPRNAMDPVEVKATNDISLELGVDKVEFALLRAKYVDPINGAVTSCWIKRYTFLNDEESETQSCALALFRHIMERELSVPESCATKTVTCVTDVFCDEYSHELFFHIPREETQLRFASTHDISKRIMRLGLRWLHNALQCIIDIHSSNLVHGGICLSNFTYDDFGNTSLGFFSNSLNFFAREATTSLDDTVDFAALLHAEVLPYISGLTSPGAKREENVSSEEQRPQEEVVNVFREVADRLIGKVEPRWTLLDARAFVRRFLEFNYDSDERNHLFTSEVSYPAYWAIQRSVSSVSFVADRRVFTALPDGASVFHCRNIHLWQIYWNCRRKMVQQRGGGFFSMPAVLGKQVPFISCGDDFEVNERFLWYTCSDEEEAWRICLDGVSGKSHRLRLAPPWMKHKADSPHHASKSSIVPPGWGVIFRVSLGTVVEGNVKTPGYMDEHTDTMHLCDTLFLTDNLERFAQQHCVLTTSEDWPDDPTHFEIVVPSPRARCYPEYIFCLSQL